MNIETLKQQVKRDLSYLAYGGKDWLQPFTRDEGHVYDVVIIGGGQSGLATAFGLLRERISNIIVVDENPEGFEGPWETYARMETLRTPKQLTSIDFGIPSLTYRSWWKAQFGPKGWDSIDKIPRSDWMNYLRWYRKVLNLPVMNEVKVELLEPTGEDIHRLHISGNKAPTTTLLTRKVILATGIQGGGEWHVPAFISKKLPRFLYAHTSEDIDFVALKNKKVAILGGGASAFENANFALTKGVSEAHIFVRRKELPRVNPIRQLEGSGIIERYHTLTDAEKYATIAHFFHYNQPPTNDTFQRSSSWPGFHLHLGAPWLNVEATNEGALVTTPQGHFTFDFLIISTGLLTDPALRPELSLIEKHITRWRDRYKAPKEIANPLVDTHPYLSPGFAFTSRDNVGEKLLHGIFNFNYSALVSCGISASALSGLKYGLPRLISAVADQLFLDDRNEILRNYFDYKEPEFIGEWPKSKLKL
ncbi:monooxygenase [Anaerobacillus alkalilacustris]|uniref:Monooxygenase n=1 Tax=Anaerobacillus alkalilacustris TaxID=393763 RepID=A0A1S2LMD0_9BACI|nr:NAD(P)/FAD-dependent oxidoreductase [Anaerobacillus alkalilacustris]OIJ13631.1 monooxygenase [Anaerobacillus alkalilacustris]